MCRVIAGWLPAEAALARAAAEGDVNLILFQPGDENHRLALPHKLFDGMAAGLPVVAPRFAAGVAGIVEATGCGVLAEVTDPAAIEKERTVLTEKAKEEGRPEAMIAKIVEGQINKFQKDVVLSKQPFVMDPDVTIEQLVANSAKELGSSNLHLAGFVRLALGEGVEKVEGPDFASEVASMMGGN